ncbi:MAG: ribonuclease HII [Candidatus Micrarchaeota archaeon]|nr:ribonuclease HII [Candidatus Micrarchaeota archaeon]
MKQIVVGIDESGRGPVIGPLVICAYACSEDNLQELKDNGVKDSKLISPAGRNKLYEKLKNGIYVVRKLTAVEITSAMDKKISLNELEAQICGELLNELEGKTSFYRAYIDSPDPIASKYSQRIKKYYRGKAELISENKADVTYPVVSAASIVAKVERDSEIENIKKIVGEDFGSGYPADPMTKNFMQRRHADAAVQEYIRHRWKTVTNLKTKQKALGEF